MNNEKSKSKAGAAKGGITSLEGLTRYDYVPGTNGRMAIGVEEGGAFLSYYDVERLIATTAGEQAEPAMAELKRDRDRLERMFMAACEDLGAISDALGIDSEIEGGADPILDAIDELKAQAAPAAPEQVQAPMVEKVRAAMIRAYNLGQTYWQQADSEYASEHKKADVTSGRFIELTNEICAKLTAPIAAAPAAEQAQSASVKLDDIEQYRMQMAGISTAALGYWSEGDSINSDYDTPALRDVARLYAKYDELFKFRESMRNQSKELPAILFDGKAVYDEITHHVGKSHCFAPEAVAATLDAVVRLMRKEGAAPAAHSNNPEIPEGCPAPAAEEVREQQECWSANEEDFNATSLDQLLNENDHLKAGDTVWVGVAVHPDPKRLVNEDSIIENISEAAYDIAGEYAEAYPDVSDEQVKELESLVAGWIKRTCPPSFWTVENIRPYVLTSDDFPEAMKRAASTEGGAA